MLQLNQKTLTPAKKEKFTMDTAKMSKQQTQGSTKTKSSEKHQANKEKDLKESPEQQRVFHDLTPREFLSEVKKKEGSLKGATCRVFYKGKEVL